MAKYLKRAQKKLKQRQGEYDAVRDPKQKAAMKRPGSMNPHKQGGISSRGPGKRR